MKRDLKPFVVEVKRGTRRSSFLEQLNQEPTMSEAQRRAEATLFTAPPAATVAPKLVRDEPSRRILPSLVEPKPMAAMELDMEALAERHPRPVGRPRKPRPALSEIVETKSSKRAIILAPASAKMSMPPAVAATSDNESTAVAAPGGRTRLRERSTILARYVLGTKPAPGARWSRPVRRLGRDAPGDR